MKPCMEEFETLLDKIKQSALDRETGVMQQRDVVTALRSELKEASLSQGWQEGIGLEDCYQRFEKYIQPGLSMSNSARFLGLVTGGVTPAALIGDFLSSVWDQSVISHDDSSAAKSERLLIKLLKRFFNLPLAFDGVLTSGATSANLISLALARQYWGDQLGVDIPQQGLAGMPHIRVFSALPHASILKSLSILGLGREAFISIPCENNSAQIDLFALEKTLQMHRGEPCIVVASAGEVNTGEFDPIDAMATLCQKYHAWFHVDAAFGLFANLTPAYQYLCQGIERADSVTTDLHKWLNVPYDCGVIFSPHAKTLPRSFHSQAAYLHSDTESALDSVAPMHLGIENSRRFRALPALLTILAYGKKGYAEMLSQHCKLAQVLAAFIEQSSDYSLCYPNRLNIVIFHHRHATTPQENLALLQAINDTGKVYMTPTVFKGRAAIRAAFCNWRTGPQDLDIIIDCLNEVGMKFTSPERCLYP